jgi:Flp pilus assembly protein TadD
MGNYPEARGALEKAVELAPEGITWPRENLATVRILEGDFEGAIEAFEQIEPVPDDPKMIGNIGTAYFFFNRLDEAERYYKLAVKLSPRSPIEHGNLADLYVRQGREQEARRSYLMALRLTEEALLSNPKDNDLRVNQVRYAAKAGECDTASRLADTLKTELPKVGRYHHNRAVAYALCGKREATLDALTQAVELGVSPDFIREEDEFQSLRDDPEFIQLVGESQ